MINYKKIWVFISICSLAFLFSGCVTMPPKLDKPIVKSKSFETSFDITWDAVIKSITALGEFINVAQKDSGLVSLQKLIPTGEVDKYALAPSGMIWDNIVANVSVLVTKQDENNIKVTINTKILGTGRDSGEVFWRGVFARTKQIEMGSRGVIEKEYLDKIASSIPGAKTYEWLEEKSEEKKTEE